MLQDAAHRFALRTLLLGLALLAAVGTRCEATIVRYQFSIDGQALAPVDVRLFHTAMPRSTDNFLDYVNADRWDDTFVHRRATFGTSGVDVVQGGGFSVPSTGLVGNNNGQLFIDIDPVATFAPIDDEPGNGVAGISNTRGTIAYAKSGPNTATSQWFFSLGDNSVLDDPNDPGTGGFAAFGRILGDGLTTLDLIGALPVINLDGGLLRELPMKDQATVQALIDAANNNQPFNVLPTDVVQLDDVFQLALPDGDYNFDGVVDAADYTVWRDSNGSTTLAEADGNGDGVVNGADLTIWQNNYGAVASSAAFAVPEPTASLLVVMLGVVASPLRRSFRA
ncbi:Peptidyl-prolyl cis-trans isomerase A precursor [Planctomycetes bacterium MalM25]|nr:Peptidyl-prolyl cis-trans isomerase A precursor [Planctomycetes bacterium MalM25]